MGSGASITDLSAAALADAVGKLGKSYESVSKEIVDSGISGTVLFSTVHDNEQQFRSFIAENFKVTRPLHQTVLYMTYAGLLNNDGGISKSVHVPFEIRETLERPPSSILTDLFQIQGIKLDPENVAGAVDDIAAAIHASIGEDTICDGINSFHCFIGYRVLADKVIAESLFDKLTVKGFKPFLDKFKLKNGLPWKDGFLQGLKGSKCFVSVISAGALSLCKDKSRNHTWDNYLLEIETALRYKHASGNSAFIIPVHAAEMVTVEGRTMLCKFCDFAGSLYADTIEGSSVPSHLDSLKEVVHSAYIAPIHAAEKITVEGRSMFGKIGDFAGSLYAEKVESLLSHSTREKAHVDESNVALVDGISMVNMGGGDMINAKNNMKPTKSEPTSPGPGVAVA